MNRGKITPLKNKATGYQLQAVTFNNVFNMVEPELGLKKALNPPDFALFLTKKSG